MASKKVADRKIRNVIVDSVDGFLAWERTCGNNASAYFAVVANMADSIPPLAEFPSQFYQSLGSPTTTNTSSQETPVDAAALLDVDGETGLACKRCKKKGKVTYVLRQTRCADEGSTAFYSCGNCGSSWS